MDKWRAGPIIIDAALTAERASGDRLVKPPASMPISVSQGAVVMTPNLLILGGTAEASALTQIIAKTDVRARLSYAGRVDRPRQHGIETRIGGFGGVHGLVSYLEKKRITHVVDATHPFATKISCNALEACARLHIPIIALTRPPWIEQLGDRWRCVPDLATVIKILDQPARRVMLAIGRKHLPQFYAQPHHTYLLRLVDPPEKPLDFPNHTIEISRGPFKTENDATLLREHRIDLIISRNSGGAGAYAKIVAARSLGISVIMVNRPQIPDREETHHIKTILPWLTQSCAERGV